MISAYEVYIIQRYCAWQSWEPLKPPYSELAPSVWYWQQIVVFDFDTQAPGLEHKMKSK